MSTAVISTAPVVTLSNGLRVANFSSPHPFNFEDGSVLEACQPDRVAAGALEREEETRPWGMWDRDDIVAVVPYRSRPGAAACRPMWDRDDIVAVVPKFSLSEQVWNLLVDLEKDNGVDIVLIPFPVLEALRNARREDGRQLLQELTKVGTICVKDRQTKEIHINRFCR